jgi:intraflagellar transport protein 56
MMRGIKQKKPVVQKGPKMGGKGQPSLDEFLAKRDYTGALALLEFKLKCQDGDTKDLLMWIGYCAFHLGNFRRAEDAYKELIDNHDVPSEVYLFLACCYFYQQMYEEAEKAAEKGPADPLMNRILFNIAHRTGDENKLMTHHQTLKDRKEDQLSLAAVHYLRSHHQEVSAFVKDYPK